MAATSAMALVAAFNHVDPRLHPSATARDCRHASVDLSLSAPDQYEALLGRRLSPTPDHLTKRILYLPSHDDKVTHLPLYDFTEAFKATIKGEPLGSSRFKTTFGLMHKPIGDGRDSSVVSYLVDFAQLEAGSLAPTPRHGRTKKHESSIVATKGTIQRRSLFGGEAEVEVMIQPQPCLGTDVKDGSIAYTIAPSSTTAEIPVSVSFPIAPTLSRFGSSRNAWFTFTVPSLLNDEITLQWQMHPVQHGMLRYTLVEVPQHDPLEAENQFESHREEDLPPFSATREQNQNLVRAIYHNVGLGFSLSQPFSEGALLLQSDLDPEIEAIIVASLLGLLWRARKEESKPRRNSKPETGAGPSRRSSVNVVENGSLQTQRTGILGKILRKR